MLNLKILARVENKLSIFVDVADITMLVNYILGKNPVGIVLANADMNGDSEYNVTDLTLICNVILGK